MNRCHCQSPPVRADGGSWRSGSPAAGLSRPGMPDGVLGLYTLRPRTVLLQPVVPQRSPAPAAPGGQPQLSAESGRPARPPGSAAAVPARGPRQCRPRVTDRSSLSVISPAPSGYGETITTPSPRGPRLCCDFSRRAGWTSGSVSGCAARSAAGQAVSSILSHTFHDEGELA